MNTTFPECASDEKRASSIDHSAESLPPAIEQTQPQLTGTRQLLPFPELVMDLEELEAILDEG